MAARVALVIVLAACLLIWVVHEQPETSVLPCTPFFVWARGVLRGILNQVFCRVFTWMGAFGAATRKPTQLLSNVETVELLHRALPKDSQQTVQLVNDLGADPSTGKRRVSGSSNLKDSQVYPVEYGRACFRIWHENPQMSFVWFEMESDSDEEIDWEAWQRAQNDDLHQTLLHADLDEVAEFLHIPVDHLM